MTRQEYIEHIEQEWRKNALECGECDSMVFYGSWMDALLNCDDDKELAAAVRILFGYVRWGAVPTYDEVAKVPLLRSWFTAFTGTFRRSWDRYVAKRGARD